jgi:hypothetical protein
MQFTKVAALAFVAALLPALPASAETRTITVPANRTSSVETIAFYNNETCRSGAVPQMQVTRAPANGKVSFRQFSGTLNESSGRCSGKRVSGQNVIYTPRKGFRGTDSFTVRYSHERYQGTSRRVYRSTKFRITVK